MPSLLEVIEKKYILGEDELQDELLTPPTPKRGPPKAVVPQILVLNECQVNSIGDEGKLLKLCSNIQEIDLSRNQLTDWNEIAKLLRLYPSIKFLNLSFNNLSSPLDSCITQMRLRKLDSLFLVSTNLQWSSLWKLLDRATNLHELDLSLNNFEAVEMEGDKQYPSITNLLFKGNPVKDFDKIDQLGRVFPNLRRFSLSSCHIQGDTPPNCWRSFPSLKTLYICSERIAKEQYGVIMPNGEPMQVYEL